MPRLFYQTCLNEASPPKNRDDSVVRVLSGLPFASSKHKTNKSYFFTIQFRDSNPAGAKLFGHFKRLKGLCLIEDLMENTYKVVHLLATVDENEIKTSFVI